MLSNPTGSLDARQRQHRRQSSTPSAYEGVALPAEPNAGPRQVVAAAAAAATAAGHRRGLSLDRRRHPTPTARQDYQVSMTTNTSGLAPRSQHHVLREAQQQRIQACPGNQQQQQQQRLQQLHQHQQQQRQHQHRHHHHHHQHHYPPFAPPGGEPFLMSPHETPHAPRFDSSPCFDTSAIPFDAYGPQLSLMMQKNHESFASNMAEAKELDLYGSESDLSAPAFLGGFPDSPSAHGWPSEAAALPRPASRRISNGIADRVNKYESLGMDDMQRPITPPNQNGTSYFPPTPMETPHDRLPKHEARPDRFQDGYDESMEETIKPQRSRTSHGAPNVFQEMRQQAQAAAAGSAPSPPRTGAMPSGRLFGELHVPDADYMSMSTLRSEFARMEGGIEGLRYDMAPAAAMQEVLRGTSHGTASDRQAMDPFMSGGVFDGGHTPDLRPPQTPGAGAGTKGASRRASPHRRTDSVASIASAASIASINIEDTKTETGVTMEEIAQHIRSPETTDGKWTCLFEDCGKKFGRKENIKSHVQTHLNDRQYRCPTCKKCFVRQHDLKRHAKIHTGIKPYPCECGNSFARHDALTRHRQRGMCIGAFDGVVRKVVKRGRPRKNRPDMEARVDKSARQRNKNKLSISSASSVSACSDSSAANSPSRDLDMFDDDDAMQGLDEGAGAGAAVAAAAAAAAAASSLSSAPMPSMAGPVHDPAPPAAPPAAPMAPMAAPSPSAASIHSYVSPEAMMDTAPSNLPTPAKSAESHCPTPPPLSQSSPTPPAPAPTAFFDADAMVTASAPAPAPAPAPAASAMADAEPMGGDEMPLELGDHDDLLLQFTDDDGLVPLDRDGGMLMMSKFDDEFDNVGMFSSDDMFFGST